MLRRTKTSGPSRRIKELPVAISEHAYFLRSTWLKVGFDLLRTHANYKRDYRRPRPKQDGLLEKKPASYADGWTAGHPRATAGGAGLLDRAQREVRAADRPVANGGSAPGQGPSWEVEARGLRHLR